MKTVRIKNRSISSDIRICKIYHTTKVDGNLLTTPVSSSGIFTGADLAQGIEFQVQDSVDQFIVVNLPEDDCEGAECKVCTNIGSGSISGEFTDNDILYSIQPGRFGKVDYDGQFSGSVTSDNDITSSNFTNNHAINNTFTLTATPTPPYVFEGWFDNVNRTGPALSTNTTVTVASGSIDGTTAYSTNWFVKYVNNEPLFKLGAPDGSTVIQFTRARNENRGPEEIAKFYFSDLDGDDLTVSLNPDPDNHFSFTENSDHITFQQVTSSLDYESKTAYSMSISVSDGTDTTLLPVRIDVIDNLQPTVLDQAMSNFGENSADGAIVGQIISSDPDSDAISFINISLHSISYSGKSLSTGSFAGTGFNDPTADAFNISSTGQITKKSGSYLNHRIIDSYTYQVTADDDYNEGTSTALITIPVVQDGQTVYVSGDGDNNVYVVETALLGDSVYDDPSGVTGSLATFTANLPVTWSVTSTPYNALSIDSSGTLTVNQDIDGSFVAGDKFYATVTGTSSIGRTHVINIVINVTADTSPATITGLGTSSFAYVIESAVENDSIYLSSNGYSGTRVKFESDQTPTTWSVTPTSKLEIDSSGYVTLGSDISGSSFSHPQTIASKVVATNTFGNTSSLDFTLQITENTAPDIIFDNHVSSFDTNYAIANARLVTASFNDIEGDSIDHGSFTFTDTSGQLDYVKAGDVYYIYALNPLSASAYSFDIGIEDEHGFSKNEETHTINVGFAQNYPPTITYNNHTVNLFSNLAVSGATLVTASISDTEGDPINYDSFTFIDPSGELNAVRDGGVYYIQANQNLTSLDYEFTASIADNHAFGTADHSFSLQGSSTGILRNNSVFVVETGLTGLGYEATKGFGSGVSASLDVIYSPNIGGQAVQSYTSSNPAVVVDNSGNLTLGLDMSTTTSGSGNTYTSDITFTDQYGNVGTGVVDVEVTYPNSGSYIKFEAIGFFPPQVVYSGSIVESGQFATGSFVLYSEYIDDGTKVSFYTSSNQDAIINEDYTLSNTEFVMMNNTGSITVTAIEDQKGETILEQVYLQLTDYGETVQTAFPYYDSAGNLLATSVSKNPFGSIIKNLRIEDTSRSYLSLTPDKTTVNEGGTVTWTLLSQNVADGTEVMYDINTIGTTASLNTDFTMSSDRFTMYNNTGSVSASILTDALAEPTESIRVNLAGGWDMYGVFTGSAFSSPYDSSGNTYFFQGSSPYGNATVYITNVDADAPTITITGNNPHTHEVKYTYTDAGATASDTVDGNLTTSIAVTNNVNDQVSGSYTVVYDVSDSAGNTAQATRTVNVVDTSPPVITLQGTSSIQVYQGQTYTDAGATAQDAYEGNITSDIITTNPVNTSNLGTYTVRYNVDDASGNSATEVTRTVNVVANNIPIISGNKVDYTVEVGGTFGRVEALAGVSASDTEEGDITADIVLTNPVNTAVIGTYTVRYNVDDSSGNSAVEKTTNVYIIDTTAPVITMLGTSPIDVAQGTTYSDAGATASDNYDGDITGNITTTTSVNTATTGTYTVKYNVSDSEGNAATEVVRTVNVVPATRDFSYSLYNLRLDFDMAAISSDSNDSVSKDSISGTGLYEPDSGANENWSVDPIQVNRQQGTDNIKNEDSGYFDGYYNWQCLSGSKLIGSNGNLAGGASTVDLAYEVNYGTDIDSNPPSVYSFDANEVEYLAVTLSYVVETTSSLDMIFGVAIWNESTGTPPHTVDPSDGWQIYYSFAGEYNGLEFDPVNNPGVWTVSEVGGEIVAHHSDTIAWVKPVVGFYHPSGSGQGGQFFDPT
jgi:hypothetical protein